MRRLDLAGDRGPEPIVDDDELVLVASSALVDLAVCAPGLTAAVGLLVAGDLAVDDLVRLPIRAANALTGSHALGPSLLIGSSMNLTGPASINHSGSAQSKVTCTFLSVAMGTP